MAVLGESTATEWDSFQAQRGVHHEQPAATDWAPADQVEKGYPSSDEGGASITAYYPMDEGAGTTMNDITGNGHNGSLQGSVAVGQPGILGTTCYTFDRATDDRVNSLGDDLLPSAGSWTMSVWVDVASVSDGDDMVIIGQTTPTPASGGDDFLIYASTDFGGANNQVRVWSDSTGELLVGSDLRGAGWTHLTVVKDGDDYTLYENGSSVDTVTNATSYVSGEVELAHQPSSTASRPYQGGMDELRIYGRALTGPQVQALYDTVAGTSEYWASKQTS